MLSNETPQNTSTIDAYRETLMQMRVRDLAQELVKGERCEDPRELPNPAHSVTRIRKIVPACDLRPNVDQQCKDYNSRVAGVGSPEKFKHLW